MPVEHMVWVRFKPTVSPQRRAEHMRKLEAMVQYVPVIQSMRTGENFTDRAKGCTHGFIVTLATRADLPRYLEHPKHVEVAKALREDSEELMAMDIEC